MPSSGAEFSDPIARFAHEYERARGTEAFDATRVALATVSKAGVPSVRFVLVKEFGADGFAFYTNYGSPKAQDLDATGMAALAWHWDTTGTQVRVSGPVTRASAARSDAYFQSRPRGSQIGAWASAQSSEVATREELLAKSDEAAAKFGDGPVPRPDFWGGYVLTPVTIEFWYEGEFRLHDRFRYTRSNGLWTCARLSP